MTDPAAARSLAAPSELDELKARIERASWPNQPGGLPVVYVGDLLDWLDESFAALAAARLALQQEMLKLESWTVDDPLSPFCGERVVSLSEVVAILRGSRDGT